MKSLQALVWMGTCRVAPLAGAWIEIRLSAAVRYFGVSPPSRGRGLKCRDVKRAMRICGSPPSRGRGLKS